MSILSRSEFIKRYVQPNMVVNIETFKLAKEFYDEAAEHGFIKGLGNIHFYQEATCYNLLRGTYSRIEHCVYEEMTIVKFEGFQQPYSLTIMDLDWTENTRYEDSNGVFWYTELGNLINDREDIYDVFSIEEITKLKFRKVGKEDLLVQFDKKMRELNQWVKENF